MPPPPTPAPRQWSAPVYPGPPPVVPWQEVRRKQRLRLFRNLGIFAVLVICALVWLGAQGGHATTISPDAATSNAVEQCHKLVQDRLNAPTKATFSNEHAVIDRTTKTMYELTASGTAEDIDKLGGVYGHNFTCTVQVPVSAGQTMTTTLTGWQDR